MYEEVSVRADRRNKFFLTLCDPLHASAFAKRVLFLQPRAALTSDPPPPFVNESILTTTPHSMRLINVHTKKLKTFYNEKIPPYAILSHMWLADEEEVTYTQMQTPDAYRHMLGFRKIEFLCQQARDDGYEWAWMDTCSIDKTSSAELSEAINSMFAWYRDAKVCYAYLADVVVEVEEDPSEHDPDAAGWLASRWWSRAWTLQEFVAPNIVIFYDAKWNCIGNKTEKSSVLQARMGIDEETLKDPRLMFNRSVAQRMSWAAKRQATRSEDIAYSLLGLFEINMPLLYGEGTRAFLRLQQEILRTVNDQSLFAWGFVPLTIGELTKESLFPSLPASQYGLFADMPLRFQDCGKIVSYHGHGYASDVRSFNGALHLEMPLTAAPHYPRRTRDRQRPEEEVESGYSIGLLPCGVASSPEYLIGIILARMSGNQQFARERLGSNIFTFLVPATIAGKAQARNIRIGDGRFSHRANLDRITELRCSLVLNMALLPNEYKVLGTVPENLRWDKDCTICLPDHRKDWPETIAIGLYDPDKRSLLCMMVYLSFSSGRPALLIRKFTNFSEYAAQERFSRYYRSAPGQLWGPKRERHWHEISITMVKLFNHVIYTLELGSFD